MKFDLHHLLSGKQAQWICMALITLFSTLILIELTYLNWSPVSMPIKSAPDKTIPTVAKEDTFESILKASLFGVYVSNDLNDGNVKQSMLNLTLVGILFADKMDASQVIIRASSGEEKTYKIGDSVPGEAIIKKISANGILVEHRGSLESLTLPKNELTFEPVAKPLTEEE